MSYLKVPRIHFGGRFYTDPSTVNNDPTHYDPKNTKPSPWQEPNGLHHFKFVECQVTEAIGLSGPSYDDPVFAKDVVTTDNPSPAKIVDIDVYQQGVSTIYGMEIKIPISDDEYVLGQVDPLVLCDVWFNAVIPARTWDSSDYGHNSYGGDMNACGWFQSVIRVSEDNWKTSNSKIMNELKEQTIKDQDGNYLISIKLVADGYENVPQSANFRYGRMAGTLGPVLENEPLYNPGSRYLEPRAFNPSSDPWYYPSFNRSPFLVDSERGKLVIDLTNSIARKTVAGDPADLGTLSAVISNFDNSGTTDTIGTVNYLQYNTVSNVVEIDISPVQIKKLNRGVLQLQTSREDIGDRNVLAENPYKVQIAAEIRPVRLSGAPETNTEVDVYISQNGAPLSGKQLAVRLESVKGNTPGVTVPPTNPGNTPQADGALSAKIGKSDENGYAKVTLTVNHNPGARTEELDGQLYFIIPYDPEDITQPDWKNPPMWDRLIVCLVWSDYKVIEQPQWEDVQKIMAPYDKIYPSMREKIELSKDPDTFFIFANNPPWAQAMNPPLPTNTYGLSAGAIPFYMALDVTDPRYMPLTRDLSPAKIQTVMNYIKIIQKPQ